MPSTPFSPPSAGHGNGLGLSQVRDFVWRSGGKIELNSAEGDGTTVHMRFPWPAVIIGRATGKRARSVRSTR